MHQRMTWFGLTWVGVTFAFVSLSDVAPMAWGQDINAGKRAIVRLVKDRPASGRFVATDLGYMIPYEVMIPGTNVSFTMQPVPGRNAVHNDQGVVTEAAIEPFWIAEHEVTWAEYVHYMAMYQAIKAIQARHRHHAPPNSPLDGITAPTEMYEPMLRYEYLKGPRSPASSMTQFAARQYTHWLTQICEQTFAGEQTYCLPTETQWRYACLAGAKSKWSHGNDPTTLDRIAVFEHADDREDPTGPAIVGSKLPNRWGLYDMHGNLAEWVLRKRDMAERPRHPPAPAGDLYDWIACGGSWQQPAKNCQATSVLHSSDEWWEEDPDVPFSPHWFANVDYIHQVGFRVASPLGKPTKRQLFAYWQADNDQLLDDVSDRINGGRGASAKFTPAFMQLLRQLKKDGELVADQPWRRNK